MGCYVCLHKLGQSKRILVYEKYALIQYIFFAFGTVVGLFPHLSTILIQIDIILYLCRHSGTPAQRALFSA